jgi:hypothetical protein
MLAPRWQTIHIAGVDITARVVRFGDGSPSSHWAEEALRRPSWPRGSSAGARLMRRRSKSISIHFHRCTSMPATTIILCCRETDHVAALPQLQCLSALRDPHTRHPALHLSEIPAAHPSWPPPDNRPGVLYHRCVHMYVCTYVRAMCLPYHVHPCQHHAHAAIPSKHANNCAHRRAGVRRPSNNR